MVIMFSTSQQVCVVPASASELCTLLNVADEQVFLQESMLSEAVQECIRGGDTNLLRVQVLCQKMEKELAAGNMKIYDSLCEYFLKRAEAYQSMHQRFKANSELYLAQQKTKPIHWRSHDKSSDIKPLMDMNKIDYLIQQVSEIKWRLDACVPQLQSSLETVCKELAGSPPFPNPYCDEMREKFSKANPIYAKHHNHDTKPVPLFCDENGEYFVDWNNDEEQWRFGKYGKSKWSSSFLVRCSLLLPRQFNANGMNDRTVRLELAKNGQSLIIKMIHDCDYTSPFAYEKAISFKFNFHLLIKYSDETSFSEIRERIHCRLGFRCWTNVFQSIELPFSLFSTTAAPSLRLTVSPL